MKDNSMIKSVLKSHVQAKIDEAVQSTENAILVFMGIEQFAGIDELSAHIADLDTYSINGNKKVFNKAWFSSLFPTLLAPLQGDYHILSFAQFSYLISYSYNTVLCSFQFLLLRFFFFIRSLFTFSYAAVRID